MLDKIVTIILARKQSRRLKNKNIIPSESPVTLCGKPLILWTIDFSIDLGYPVHLFTDCKHTKKVLADLPINVHDKLFENDSGIHETGKELTEYNKKFQADHIILLQITSPLRRVENAKMWIDNYFAGDFNAGFAAVAAKSGCYYSRNSPVNFSFSDRNYNSCGIKSLYRETGSFYIFKTTQLEKSHFLHTNKMVLFDDPYDIDINTIDDLRKAEIIYRREENDKAEN